jgi:oxygen-independent coproporphyrinogen-3 oxidase
VHAQLYIHVPFCRRKCGYCAFYSEADADPVRHDRYLDKLERDLAAAGISEPVETVFVGGGTPSLLAEPALARLFGLIARYVPLLPDAEFTLEANPETLTLTKLELIRSAVNRLSLGVQSFDPARRRQLGRDCSDEAIAAALDGARRLGFPHLNCDLIYAVPGQTAADWTRDLAAAVAAGVDHLSAYALTVEEGSRLAAEGSAPADDEISASLWELTGAFLAGHGLERYEISNYARPGTECRHNARVWAGSRLYGFGPAAASWDGRARYRQVPDLAAWLAGALPEMDELDPAERRNEIFAVQLRTVAGWTRSAYLELPGATPAEWAHQCRKAGALRRDCPELLTATDETIALTAAGLLFWDELAINFIGND